MISDRMREVLKSAPSTFTGAGSPLVLGHPANSRSYAEFRVEGPSGEPLLTVKCYLPKSQYSISIYGQFKDPRQGHIRSFNKSTIIKTWDSHKVAAAILVAFYKTTGRHISTNVESHRFEKAIAKEIVGMGGEFQAHIPFIVRKLHDHIREHHDMARGEDIRKSIDRVKREFEFLVHHASEDEVLSWYRETQIKRVMES